MTTEHVSIRLYDVNWQEGGVGKHGNGPFATRRQAEACLRAHGWPGVVEIALWRMDRVEAERVVKRVGRSLSDQNELEPR